MGQLGLLSDARAAGEIGMIVERLTRPTAAPFIWPNLIEHVRVDREQGTEASRHAHVAAQEAED